jgi:hypothetical protein
MVINNRLIAAREARRRCGVYLIEPDEFRRQPTKAHRRVHAADGDCRHSHRGLSISRRTISRWRRTAPRPVQ